MAHKYRAVKTVVDGITFASKAEARRYGELKILAESGKIRDLRLQPVIELQPSYKHLGKTVRAIKYVPDFAYLDLETGHTIYEDVKGVETPVYRLKRTMLWYRYPQYQLKEIRY